MASLYGISIKLTADLKDFSSKLQNAERSLKKFGRNMQSIGKNMSLGLTAPLVGLGALAVKTFAEFEQSMAKVQAVSGATQQEFDKLSKLARDLGRSTKFSASEVANLELEFSKLGFIPDQIEKLTASTLELATVADTNLGNAATIAGATMRSFGIEAENANRVVDVMASSFSSSALDIDKFSVAMATVAPVAKSSGRSLEETTAQLSVLINRGIDASTAGTALRNVFLKLSENGITWEQAASRITKATDKNAAALELFGTRGATVAQILAANGAEIDALTDKYNNSAGSAESMAEIMNSTLLVTIEKLKSSVSELAIAFGQTIKPAIEVIISKVNTFVDWLNTLDESTRRTIVTIGAIAAAIGPVLLTVGLLAKGIAGLSAAFALLTSPITLIIAAIAALIAAGLYLYDNWDAVRENMAAIMVRIKNGFIEGIKQMILVTTWFHRKIAEVFGLEIVEEGVNKLMDWLDGFKSEVPQVTTEFKSFGETAKSLGNQLMGAAYEMGIFKQQSDETTEALKNVEEQAQRTGAVLGNGGSPGRPAAPQAAENKTQASLNNELQGQAIASVNEHAEALERLYNIREKSLALGESELEQDQLKLNNLQMLANSAETLGSSLVDAFFSGQSAGEALKETLIQISKQIIKAFLGQAIMAAITKSLQSAGNPITGLILAGVAVAGVMAMYASKVPKLAKGGLAFGRSYAMVGDNPNASSDPEVISPLSKLKEFLQPQTAIISGTTVKVRGEDVYIALEAYKNKRGRFQ